MREFVNVAGTDHRNSGPSLENQILDLLESFGREKISVRYVTLNDPSRTVREEWMDRTFHTYEQFDHADNDTRFLSSLTSDFNLLVVGGNDPVRMGALLRRNRPLLANRIKISLVSRSNSQKRARLLGHGFDDVFDINRISPAEALARILAIRRRQSINEERVSRERDFQQRLAEVCHLQDMPPRQVQAMTMLLRNKGRVVTYGAMMDEIGAHGGEVSPANLKVIISKLRKCLTSNAKIVSLSRTGYRLDVAG